MRIREEINRQPRAVLMGLCLSLVALIGMVDYLNNPRISFAIFYVLPVAAAAWYAGRRAGLVVALASAVTWLLADLPWARPGSLLPFWNALVRLLFFAIATFALASVRRTRDRQMEMVNFIVHDLRSPLTNVMAGLDLIEASQAIRVDEEEREVWEMARVSVHRIMTMTDSLLDVARLESGRMPLHLTDVPVEELVEASVGQLALWAKQGEVEIVTDLDAHAGVVRADRGVTVRVLINLLGNAVKFSPPGSTITIRTFARRGGRLGFSVSDEGPGVPKEWATRVFDKFGQVGARHAGAPTGTGLGLTFCRLAVEAQGGQIWIEPEQDRGTMVVFTLPLAAGASVGGSESVDQPVSRSLAR